MDKINTALTILIIAVCLLTIAVLFLTQKINRFLGGNKAQSSALQPQPQTAAEQTPAHIRAVIVAAISAYYGKQASEGTEFIVRRIKGL